MSVLTDTHCHLYLPEFENDRLEVIKNSALQGINKILVPAIDFNSSLLAIRICNMFPNFLFPALGIHPNYSHKYNDSDLEKISTIISRVSINAIGEIGLDFYRDKSPKNIQISVLTKMLDLALNHSLPICIHNREAEDVLLPILDDWVKKINHSQSYLLDHPGVFHAFDGSPRVAEWAVNHQFKLGICGNITYKNADPLHEILRSIDIKHFLLETDSPYLTPEPKRGQRNDPRNIQIIACKLSEITGIELNEIIEKTSSNAANLFRW